MATDCLNDRLAMGSAIAGGAIAAALIEILFEKSALNLDESRTVLERALRNVSFHNRSDGAREAADIITKLMRGRFSARQETS